MPKFTFPIPGRRQKTAPSAPATAPLTKAQKILGTGELNIDSPTLPKDQARWAGGSRPTSGISISISESSTGRDEHDGGGLGILREGEVVNVTSPRFPNYDDESNIIPQRRGSGYDGRSLTDASSLRRRESNSTIMSYYDKTKVPLSISQQTSNSAMAKGLPSKANSLLDISGVMSPPRGKKKKKPAMLDLSYLLPKGRSPTSANTQKSLALGAELATSSPSSVSASPFDADISPARQRSDRILGRRRKNSSGAGQGDVLSPPHTGKNSSRGGPEAAGLSNLYEHYEQMSFRDVMARDRGEKENPSFMSPPLTTSSKGRLTPASRPIIRVPPRSLPNGIETPITAVMTPSALHSPTADCSASISSRHTRTSKASKRTNPSIVELDLQQNSVLSLSSDSEDDYVEPPPKLPISVPGNVPRSPGAASAVSEQGSRAATSRGPPSALPMLSRNASAPAAQFLSVPGGIVPPPKPPAINPRTSSLSLSTTSTAKPSQHPRRTSSRLSILTTSTTGGSSITQPLRAPHTHEARTIKMVPAQASPYRGGSSSPPEGRSPDQPTPPLSPSSVDFYLRSQRTSLMDYDQGSVRSARSFGSRNSDRASHGRLMAVTRQEEMLLAALRTKRAHMRESIIAEFEEDQQQHATPSDEPAPAQRTSVSAITEVLQPQPRRARSTSVSFKDFPMHIEEEDETAAESATHSDPTPAAAGRTKKRDPQEREAPNERVLLFFDQPDRGDDDFDGAEPSPDLSDFMDLDDGGSSDSFPFQTPDDHSPVGTRAASKDRRSRLSGGSRPHSGSFLPSDKMRKPARRGDDDVHVRIVEDPVEIPQADDDLEGSDAGIPRPDSPVDAPLALPRKKAVRISAVGRVGMEAGWWGHDG